MLAETPPSLTVQSLQSVTQPVTVKTAKEIVPGNYQLLLTFAARYSDDLMGRNDTLLATTKVNIDVPGLSETMQLFGLPSFLLLPGMLTLTAFGFGWAWVVSRPGGKFPLDWKTPGFLVFAITLSGLAAFLYPRLGSWFGATDYLRGFNLADVV